MRESPRYTPPPVWKTLLEQTQVGPAVVLADCGITSGFFDRNDAKVTAEQYFAFWQSANAALPRSALSQLMARYITVGPFDAALFTCLCYSDPLSALLRLSEIKSQTCPLTLAVMTEADSTRLIIGRADEAGPVPAIAAMYELAILARFVALASGGRVQLARVELPLSAMVDAGLYETIDCTVSSGAEVVGYFRSADLIEPFAMDIDVMWRFFEGRFCRLSDIDQSAPTVERVRAALMPLLPTGQYTIDRVARILGLSKRTLQRKLHVEGHRFLSVLQQLRVELANHYLNTTSAGLIEIALLLGFANTESLARAYSGWTGQRLRSIRAAQALRRTADPPGSDP